MKVENINSSPLSAAGNGFADMVREGLKIAVKHQRGHKLPHLCLCS